MSMTTQTIPFFTHDIKIKEVTEASLISDFNLEGKTLKTLGKRLNHSSLEEIVGTNDMILNMRNGDFIRFTESIKERKRCT